MRARELAAQKVMETCIYVKNNFKNLSLEYYEERIFFL